jgi:hypothetical protein
MPRPYAVVPGAATGGLNGYWKEYVMRRVLLLAKMLKKKDKAAAK